MLHYLNKCEIVKYRKYSIHLELHDIFCPFYVNEESNKFNYTALAAPHDQLTDCINSLTQLNNL